MGEIFIIVPLKKSNGFFPDIIMTSIQFYHLTASRLENALPRLLEKAFSAGYRVIVAVESDGWVEQLDKLLWTYDPGSFLPHGGYLDKNPENYPVLISTTLEAVNSANLLMVTDGRSVENPHAFERILDIFDGNDGQATQAARQRWKQYKDSGYEIDYFSQNERGGWVKLGGSGQ